MMFLYYDEIPPFMAWTLAQARCWNPSSECDLYLVGNHTEVDQFIANYSAIASGSSIENIDLDVIPVYLEDLEISEDYWTFYRKRRAHFQGFW
jgi:hypothetical protein